MRKIPLWLTFLTSCVCFNASATMAPESPLSLETQLPSGETLVVATGAGEAQSIGSYSVRLYHSTEDKNKRTFFASGLIAERSGTLGSIELIDLNENGQLELLVITRSVGTGNYINAAAYAIEQDRISELLTLDDLAPEYDVIASIKHALLANETDE
ncbi:PliI family lysozyme inhibitor of I-type lysozyme [Motilimonas sp. KMU-193]|uniref:PliI family lysozyme inhibitor of I-type lysozyme n=1 Tax=Motilimonas sp. KMU-193 TaxID=3388668 RepID=UPI00396B135A